MREIQRCNRLSETGCLWSEYCPTQYRLMDVFGLDLSLLARLGGHSQPRTHRGKERFPGMTITYALIQMLERVATANPNLARIVTKVRTVNRKLVPDGKSIVRV